MTTLGSGPRSLTDMLRDLDEDSLVALLVARPDLAVPPPTSFSQVASRATTRESVRAALDAVNALDLWVAQQASECTAAITVADIAGVGADVAAAALDRLRRRALLWGDPAALRPVRALTSELSRSPLTEPPADSAPQFDDASAASPEKVDAVAAGSAFELVRRVEVLVEHVDHAPVRLRQDGGLASRESRLIGSLLDVPVAVALLHTQIAQAAGLLGILPQGRTDMLVPTTRFDDWRTCSLVDQWAELARGWRDGHPPSGSAAVKALCFEAFGPASQGRVLTAADLHSWLAWQLPRVVDDTVRRATTMLGQAAWVGVTGLGALSSFARGDDLGSLERLLPRRADTVLVQNDLTAVAAAPLTPEVARELSAIADVESRGGATVYRFTVESLRRAHAAGWSTSEIAAVLSARSSTPIPQPLTYLVADLDRSDAAIAVAARPARPVARAARPSVPLRAPATTPSGADGRAVVDAVAAAEIVATLRHANRPEASTDRHDLTPSEQTADSPLDTLREAVETGEVVWVGYVDTQGGTGERLLYAAAVQDGRLTAKDSRTGERLSVPVHRITVAHIIRGGSV